MSRAFFFATALILAASCQSAIANEFCNQDLGPLVKEREALQNRLEQINKNASQPGAREKFCATMASFISNMRKTEKYMTENQSFCQIPAETLVAVKQGITNASATRRKICTAPAAPAAGQGGGAQAGPKPPVELRLK